jgi:hypothetical protein
MFVSCRSGDTSTNAVSANPPQFVSITPNGEIAVLRDEQQVGSLPAEYIPLDYPDMPWRGDPAIGMSSDGTIYVALYAKIFVSKNGGREWESRQIDVESLAPPASERANYDSFVVLRDGTLLWAYHSPEHETDFVVRSADGGRTWQPWSQIVDRSLFGAAGGNQNCMTELADGTILWPTRLGPRRSEIKERDVAEEPWQGPAHWTTYVYRSTDGWRSWKDKSLLQEWGTETNLLELVSGRLLAAIRYQRYPHAPAPRNEPEDIAAADPQSPGTVGKRVFLADSSDAGSTWTDFRPVRREATKEMDIVLGEAHGHLVQLSDGTVVLAHERRYPYEVGDVRARVSCDQGRTWAPEAYRLSAGHGYAASVVLPDDTIVTALGNTPLNEKGRSVDGKWYAQVVRWRLPRSGSIPGKH